MKIIAVETYWTRIPFDMGGKPATTGGLNWQTMNTVWLRIVTDQGLEGWGEAFGHASAATTMAVLDTQLAPPSSARTRAISAGCAQRLSKAFHGFGRNGAHVFALSALDIALWDIAGKAAGLPLWRLFGATPVAQLTSYASLLRYGEAVDGRRRLRARDRRVAIATSSCTRSPCPRCAPRARRSVPTRG